MVHPAKRPLILVGGFSEVVELATECGFSVIGAIEPRDSLSQLPIPHLGVDAESPSILRAHPGVPIFVTPDLPEIRERLVAYYRSLGATFATLIHPGARLSPRSRIGEGVGVAYGAHVSCDVELGAFCRLNVRANVMHGCVIGDYATVAPNAVILGRVSVGAVAYVGANATVLPKRRVGISAVIGAGAVVTRDVPDRMTVAGNPARELPRG